MAETPLENALYRIKAYQGLMAAEHGEPPQSTAADLLVLIEWIECARSILGAVSVQPKGDYMDRCNKAERQRDTSYIAANQMATPQIKAWAETAEPAPEDPKAA